jgi:hypothetical protein
VPESALDDDRLEFFVGICEASRAMTPLSAAIVLFEK